MDVWVVAVIVGAALFAGALVFAVLTRLAPHRGMAAEWDTERALIGSVVTEDLTALRARLAGLPPGHAGADTAATALRAAERAGERFAANENWADNLRAATTALGRAGRAMAPDSDRPPCVFDPVHGPASAEVEWAPGGGTRRRVPVCAADATRLRAGEPPAVRLVATDEGAVPYYAAHGRYVDWLLGWYDGFDPYLTARLLAGTTIGSHLPGRIRAIHGPAGDPLGEFGPVHD